MEKLEKHIGWVLAAALVGGVLTVAVQAGAPETLGMSETLGASELLETLELLGMSGAFAALRAVFETSYGASLLVAGVGSCFVTALVEELIFRGALLSALLLIIRRVRTNWAQPRFDAAVASAVVFGLVHVVSGLLAQPWTPSAVLQALLKATQAGLFGFYMAALFIKTRSLVVPIVVHFVFDVVYFGPAYLIVGAFPSTYITGSYGDLVILLLTSVLLLPPSINSARVLRGEVVPCLSEVSDEEQVGE